MEKCSVRAFEHLPLLKKRLEGLEGIQGMSFAYFS